MTSRCPRNRSIEGWAGSSLIRNKRSYKIRGQEETHPRTRYEIYSARKRISEVRFHNTSSAKVWIASPIQNQPRHGGTTTRVSQKSSYPGACADAIPNTRLMLTGLTLSYPTIRRRVRLQVSLHRDRVTGSLVSSSGAGTKPVGPIWLGVKCNVRSVHS